jgi:parallel beta-helix repeat protein
MKATLSRSLAVLLVVSLSFFSLTILDAKADPRIITVPDEYPTIQEAINQTDDGDTVYVKTGVYIENPIINKTINLIGENKDSTIIDVTAGLKIQKDKVTITGFTIYDGHDAISLATNNCTITNNIIKQATHGIVIFGQGNYIAENIFEPIGLSSAIQLNFASQNLVENNYIDSCVEGIQIWQNSYNNTITKNKIINIEDTAISFQYSYDNTIILNSIENSGCGTSIYGSNYNFITKNNYINNDIHFSANEWYYLTWSNPRSVNTISKNYWSNYTGLDANSDGIGDTPYIIDEYNQDNYPLMTPTSTIEETPTIEPTSTPSPTPSPIQSPTPSPTPVPPEAEYLRYIIPIIIASIIILAGYGFLVYFKKHKKGYLV